MTTTRLPLWRRLLKIVLWTVMACVLTVTAVLICLVQTLDPAHLTALTRAAANRMLDADVSIGRVELSLTGHMPFLQVDVDSLTVVSRPMLRLDAATRDRLPAWGDTLLRLDRFTGGINLLTLPAGRIDLHDVIFYRPSVNIVTVNDSVSNYLIYTASVDTTASEPSSMPRISINHFSLREPGPIRYHNAHTGQHFTVGLDALTLEGGAAPTYALSLGGDFDYPGLALYNLDRLAFGLDGHMTWDPATPTELELRDFRIDAAFLHARLSTHVDLGTDIVVRDFDLALGRTTIDSIIALVPDSLRHSWGIDRLHTDLGLSFGARSTAPFNLTDDSIPHADFTLTIDPGSVAYDGARFERVGGEIVASLRGNDLDSATLAVRGLNVAGPATDLTLDATASQIASGDPLVEGCLRGHSRLDRLPRRVADLLGGYISGRLRADIDFSARPSMLTRNDFHRLHIDGDIDATDLYYLSADTATMVYARSTCLRLGTNSSVRTREGARADSLLTASVRIDSADILYQQYSMKLTDLQLGVGAENRRRNSSDTTLVIPMGGKLRLGSFGLFVIGDSIIFRMRDADGYVAMQRYRGDTHLPLFRANLDIRRMATGDPTTRFMLSRAHLDVNAHMKPRPKIPAAIRHTADSLRRAYPDIPIDSVYRLAIWQHRRRPRTGPPRVHLEYTEAETEMINWGTSKLVRRLLLGWDIEGNLTADRAGLFTPYFPIRNRVRDFNVRFNNDTILLTDVRYKAGHSDFLLSGRISNLKRGFTSRGFRSPLKLYFDVVCDTIDVNELAGTTFRGSAYAAAAADTTRREAAHHHLDMAAIDRAEAAGDERLEREMGRIVADAPDSVAPLLIPRNIDLELDIRARNVLYSDIPFHDFNGRLLAYQGALNLHHLTASSPVGAIGLNALYSAADTHDLKFGFGMQVTDFNLGSFTRLVPAIDSIMPLLRDIRGTVDADIAATCDIDSAMNLVLPTLTAAIQLQGDSLELIDKETYRKIGKWLLFKDKQSNIIDHMNVELTVRDNVMQLYPFMFDIDRYRLGVQGYNDLALNFNYHIAVLKSPLPFKFGINLKGNPDDYKIRLGRARFDRPDAVRAVSIVDTTRVNLLNQIENIFRRGIAGSNFARINIDRRPTAAQIDLSTDTISHADSLIFIREGLLPAPPQPETPDTDKKGKKAKKSKKNRKDRPADTSMLLRRPCAILPDDITDTPSA